MEQKNKGLNSSDFAFESNFYMFDQSIPDPFDGKHRSETVTLVFYLIGWYIGLISSETTTL